MKDDIWYFINATMDTEEIKKNLEGYVYWTNIPATEKPQQTICGFYSPI